jgi:hypothetical protein
MNYNALKNLIARRIRLVACTTTLAVGLMVSLPQLAHAQNITPPPLPPGLQPVPEGNEVYRVGHAIGFQNYVCQPVGAGFKFVLFTPQATLFKDNDKQIITHFFSPNPDEGGVIRATWEDSNDTSAIWAKVHQPNGAVTVDASAVDWLLLDVVGRVEGPNGQGALADTTFVQRLSTVGGVAPADGCLFLTDVGKHEFVPYTADYFFWRKQQGNN